MSQKMRLRREAPGFSQATGAQVTTTNPQAAASTSVAVVIRFRSIRIRIRIHIPHRSGDALPVEGRGGDVGEGCEGGGRGEFRRGSGGEERRREGAGARVEGDAGRVERRACVWCTRSKAPTAHPMRVSQQDQPEAKFSLFRSTQQVAPVWRGCMHPGCTSGASRVQTRCTPGAAGARAWEERSVVDDMPLAAEPVQNIFRVRKQIACGQAGARVGGG